MDRISSGATQVDVPSDELDHSFKVFHELMAKKVSGILLVSSPYDAFIMEEDGRLAQRIIHEYRGLNLSRPPRITWVSTAQEALNLLEKGQFDLVMTMPRLDDMDTQVFCGEVRSEYPELPIFLLLHKTGKTFLQTKYLDRHIIDKVYVWSGNTDLLLAIIKNVEDRWNVSYDTRRARVRVIILVEDSPIYCSSLLPLLYKEVVMQTQAVMEESINEEHRLLRMRARPKILVAENYEEAQNLYQQFKPYVLSVLSDVRFPRKGEMNNAAGFELLSMIKADSPDIPLLNLSSEEQNRNKATAVPAAFVNKNSPALHAEIRAFLEQHLGFGDFIFRLPNGKEIARAANMRELEMIIPSIPDESIYYHASANHFSTWLMARSEIELASRLKPVKATDFSSAHEIKNYLAACLRERRKGRQLGVVTDFVPGSFDPDADFVKLGRGSLGGKARGLAFVSTLLRENHWMEGRFAGIRIRLPQTLVISTEAFDAFMQANVLQEPANRSFSDSEISAKFLETPLPDWLIPELKLFLSHVNYPLAVRSSSLLEDAQYHPFAGIYNTYMIPNNALDQRQRLEHLMRAVKLVYASTYLEAPRSYAKSTLHRIEEEKMAVVIQQLTGAQYGDYFYPAISGLAQSVNFYPIGYMQPDEGIAHIALGLGKTVMEGAAALRFSPRHPQFLPQFSSVDDILKNSQRYFYALKMKNFPDDFASPQHVPRGYMEDGALDKLEIDAVRAYPSLAKLCSAYVPEEHRIRDSALTNGHLILTFANILKYHAFPLPEILAGLLDIGRKGMGSPVEIEFAVHLPPNGDQEPEFSLLQIRPMGLSRQDIEVEIEEEDFEQAFCASTSALGNGLFQGINDIIYVKPDAFDPAQTVAVAGEIGRFNYPLHHENRKYLLIGPGRWGSADRFLGIPVTWKDISGVGAMIETSTEKLHADPSQGSHFFHNITSLGITYITIANAKRNFIDWAWLETQPAEKETVYLRHVKLSQPLTIKIDGKKSHAVILR